MPSVSVRRPENRENRVGIPDGIAGPSSVGVYRHIGRSTGRGSGHRQAAVGAHYARELVEAVHVEHIA